MGLPILLFLLNLAPIQAIIPQPVIDAGVVYEDSPFIREFILENPGDEVLRILSAETSCGCTEVSIESKDIPPGGTSKIVAKIDLAGKRGQIQKEILVKTSAGDLVLTLKADVRKSVSAHGQGYLQEKIFNEPCSKCHAKHEKKMGGDLFAAVCAFCHGPHGNGGVASALNRLSFLRGIGDETLFRSIAFGNAETGMPGFLDTAKGPLSEQQIRSLVPYLRRNQDLGDMKRPSGEL